MSDRTPVPLNKLIEHVCDDGGDYNDGLGGRTSGLFDKATGVLTLTYERDEEMEDDLDDPDYNHASTEYRFQLITTEENRPA